MNLFRDQLDRYGELEHISERWQTMLQALAPSTIVVLNADDPAVAHLGDAHPNIVWFGINDTSRALAELPHAADARRCRRCGEPLIYDAVLVGHLGHWHCAACGWHRPTPSVAATAVTLHGLDGIDIDITSPAGPIAVRGLALPGLHNAYNATAAAAAALALGVPVSRIGYALQSSQAAFGRSERLTVDGRELVMLLIKNPAGANEVVRTLDLDPEPLDLVLFLNDRTADGRDVSWIWDVDYEPLLPRIRTLTIAGDRAHDLALRFRYAGLDDARVRVIPETAEALDVALAGAADGRPLYALPTYTAMLGLREVLVARGAAQEFWRDR
jgi:UDP-N-acetylmuramyl tripeptide synthase